MVFNHCPLIIGSLHIETYIELPKSFMHVPSHELVVCNNFVSFITVIFILVFSLKFFYHTKLFWGICNSYYMIWIVIFCYIYVFFDFPHRKWFALELMPYYLFLLEYILFTLYSTRNTFCNTFSRRVKILQNISSLEPIG